MNRQPTGPSGADIAHCPRRNCKWLSIRRTLGSQLCLLSPEMPRALLQSLCDSDRMETGTGTSQGPQRGCLLGVPNHLLLGSAWVADALAKCSPRAHPLFLTPLGGTSQHPRLFPAPPPTTRLNNQFSPGGPQSPLVAELWLGRAEQSLVRCTAGSSFRREQPGPERTLRYGTLASQAASPAVPRHWPLLVLPRWTPGCPHLGAAVPSRPESPGARAPVGDPALTALRVRPAVESLHQRHVLFLVFGGLTAVLRGCGTSLHPHCQLHILASMVCPPGCGVWGLLLVLTATSPRGKSQNAILTQ